MTAIALTIAGSDSGGGAGVQADLKTMSAIGVYGASVITAITAQNTLGVTAVHDVPTDIVAEQFDAVCDDLAVDAIKIGMLSSAALVETVATKLAQCPDIPVVLDPVMVAESGDSLLAEGAVSAIRNYLFPLATLITPNLHEAAKLLGGEMAATPAAMVEQAHALRALGANAVLLKGGHSASQDAADIFVDADGGVHWFSAPFIDTKNTHGTGCSLSSAIASGLAKGLTLNKAIGAAKTWLTAAIDNADTLSIGSGAGPVHHFHAVWPALLVEGQAHEEPTL
ncbi:MAG: bifunctional hydroxymethylpyrimidine kinase/phosphomethylpyrimidine kinase [Pseudomonadota bacterium]